MQLVRGPVRKSGRGRPFNGIVRGHQVVEAAAPLVEVAVAILMGVAELAVAVLVASIRPWRFVLSPQYRTRIAGELEGRHPMYRVFYFAWGTIALMASIVVVAGVWWFFATLPPREPPPPKAGEQVRHLKEKASELKERLER